jgi:uncharacterized membrane protein YdjX (TVP38/TMEM64 family)
MARPRLFALLAVLAAVSLGLSIAAGPALAAKILAGTTTLRQAGIAGLALFTLLCFLFALAGIVPGALLGLAAGAIFGISAGFTAAAAGILAGAGIAFALSRSYLRPLIATMLGRYGALARLDQAVRSDGWRLVALLRVSPVMPFSLTSYALGLSGIGLRDYLLGTLASLPALLGYVVLGALGGYGARLPGGADHGIHLALLALGAAATLALTIHLSRLLARALKPPRTLPL